MKIVRYVVLFQQVHATYHKAFSFAERSKDTCSTILTDLLATIWRRNKPTGKAGLLPGCRVKDLVHAVTGVHMALSVMDTDIIVMVTAGANHAVLLDAVSVFSASARAVVGASPMNSSPCALRPRKSPAFS